MMPIQSIFFFFNDTATTEIYTLSLHDALPISRSRRLSLADHQSTTNPVPGAKFLFLRWLDQGTTRSEEHTSELQSQSNLVCRLLLEKKKIAYTNFAHTTHGSRPLSSRYSIQHS